MRWRNVPSRLQRISNPQPAHVAAEKASCAVNCDTPLGPRACVGAANICNYCGEFGRVWLTCRLDLPACLRIARAPIPSFALDSE